MHLDKKLDAFRQKLDLIQTKLYPILKKIRKNSDYIQTLLRSQSLDVPNFISTNLEQNQTKFGSIQKYLEPEIFRHIQTKTVLPSLLMEMFTFEIDHYGQQSWHPWQQVRAKPTGIWLARTFPETALNIVILKLYNVL